MREALRWILRSLWGDRMRRLLIKLGEKPGEIRVSPQLILTFASRLKVDVNDLIKPRRVEAMRHVHAKVSG